MNLEGCTAVGLRGADDRGLLALDFSDKDYFTNGVQALAVISEGVGDYPGSEVARDAVIAESERYMTRLMKRLEGRQIDLPAGVALEKIAQNGHAAILGASKKYDGRFIGASFLGAFASSTHAWIGRAGDSRAYVVRDGQPWPLQGHAESDGADRVLGLGTSGIELYEVDIEPGDALLLCTNGIYLALGDDRLAQCVSQARDANSAATEIVKQALSAGADGNSVAAVIYPNGIIVPSSGDETVALPAVKDAEEQQDVDQEEVDQEEVDQEEEQPEAEEVADTEANPDAEQATDQEDDQADDDSQKQEPTGQASDDKEKEAVEEEVEEEEEEEYVPPVSHSAVSAYLATHESRKTKATQSGIALVISAIVIVVVVGAVVWLGFTAFQGGVSSSASSSKSSEAAQSEASSSESTAQSAQSSAVSSDHYTVQYEDTDLYFVDADGDVQQFRDWGIKAPALKLGNAVLVQGEPNTYGSDTYVYRTLNDVYVSKLVEDLNHYWNGQRTFSSDLSKLISDGYVEFLEQISDAGAADAIKHLVIIDSKQASSESNDNSSYED